MDRHDVLDAAKNSYREQLVLLGEIIERGTHSRLLEQSGFYNSPSKSQFKREIEPGLEDDDDVSPQTEFSMPGN
ncbi:MAG TPA: hypothetical protein VFI27_17720 [candidate division Zixibacteria bacterium]|nr:hypothetical protein [candidate division Zixibacteria bacterium]